MLKIVVKILTVIILLHCLPGAQNSLKAQGVKGGIRYDFLLVGNSTQAEAIFVQAKFLPKWNGKALPPETIDLYGNYRYRITDVKSGEVLFYKGFSPLFWEWQSTPEALHRKRSFYNGLFFPATGSDVVVWLDRRDRLGQWQAFFSDTLNADDKMVLHETPLNYVVDTIACSGSSASTIDLVILSEGYASTEMGKFSQDAKRLTDSLFSVDPFKQYRNFFNVVALQVPSAESGTDIPGEGIFRNTAFNSTYYTFGSERYLTTSDMKSVFDALDALDWDHFFILVNSDKYGGGGLYNHLNCCSADHPQSSFVFIHEFAHGFAGLADEYYTQSVAYDSGFYLLDIEPWEENITTLIDFDRKWKDQIEPKLPVPTPRIDKYRDKVGVFEGGGYQSIGVYSPAITCWMKEQKAGRFCPVCEKSIEKIILFLKN